MDDTSTMWDNWPIGSWHTKLLFDSCFTRLILTLKQVPRMYQNAPLSDKKSKNFLGRGHSPSPHPSPTGRMGIPPPQTSTPSAPRFSRDRRSAFPFLFIYDSNTAHILYAFPSWGGFLSTDLTNRIDAFFDDLRRFGYINRTFLLSFMNQFTRL